MKKLYTIFFSVILLLGTSCNGSYHFSSTRAVSFTPDDVRLSLSMSDFELLGETEITTFSRVYLGFISNLDSINGVEYDRRTVHKVSLKGEKDIKLPPVMKKALYKVVDMYPDADYFMSVYVKSEQQKMFGGKYVSRKALIRAYKFR